VYVYIFFFYVGNISEQTWVLETGSAVGGKRVLPQTLARRRHHYPQEMRKIYMLLRQPWLERPQERVTIPTMVRAVWNGFMVQFTALLMHSSDSILPC